MTVSAQNQDLILTCLSFSFHLPVHAVCAAVCQWGSQALESVYIPLWTALPKEPDHGLHHAMEYHSDINLFWLNHPSSSHCNVEKYVTIWVQLNLPNEHLKLKWAAEAAEYEKKVYASEFVMSCTTYPFYEIPYLCSFTLTHGSIFAFKYRILIGDFHEHIKYTYFSTQIKVRLC